MNKLLVTKSKITSNKKEIVLRGVSIPDYYHLIEKENQNIEEVIKKIKELGFNTIRVPVLPGHFLFYKEYIKNTIKLIVELCLKYDLYCILDWHAIGNPAHNETRLREYYHKEKEKQIYWYLADKDVAAKALDELSKLFGQENHVIFEIYNEPCPGEKNISKLGLSCLPFTTWRKIAVELISIVRKNSDNLILISSNYWAFNLKDTSRYPFNEFFNVAYSFHCYPLKNNQNWKEMLESIKSLPVVVTEFGYDVDERSQYKSSFKEYLEPFMKYLDEKNISWIGWCFSKSWRPRIISKWDPFELSDFGNNLIKYLD